MNSNWANRLQFSNDRDFLPEKKLQYRLWHIFALTAVVASGVSQALVTKLGVKPVLSFGMITLTIGLLLFAQISAHGSYFSDLFPGFIIVGIGLGFSFVPVSIAALAGVTQREAGLASGLFNTSQQIGGALGLAALSTLATSKSSSAGGSSTHALVVGFHWAFAGGAAVMVVALAVMVALLRRRHVARIEEAAAREPVVVGAS
jgi:MFS family permease